MRMRHASTGALKRRLKPFVTTLRPTRSVSSMRNFLVLLALVGCGDDAAPIDAGVDSGVDSAVDAGTDSAPDVPGSDAGCSLPEAQVVRFTTDDAIMLEADYYPVANGSPAVVLLHMIPPSNTRANYPVSFHEALYCRGITVLNVDRRGAGGSEGIAVEAYEGPKGALDAKGAVEWLLAQDLAPDATRIGVVGASNGTTTLLDFSVFSVRARIVEDPASLVFLSGGTYTTNQNMLDEAALGGAAALFVYPSSEAAWNQGVAATAPARWRFEEVDPGGHGTALLSDAETLVADFLAETL